MRSRKRRLVALAALVLAVPGISKVQAVTAQNHVEDDEARPASLVRRLLTRIVHDSGIDSRDLVNWAHLHGVEQGDPDRFVIPLLEPGRYTACYAAPGPSKAGEPAPAPADSCASGELPPNGELVLRLAAPGTPAARPGGAGLPYSGL